MSLRPKPEIEKLAVCAHGGLNFAELKELDITPEETIDFSVCTNPFMPPPGISKYLKKLNIERYPDSGSTELRTLLAERLGISVDNNLVGSGTTELIRLIALAYFRSGDRILIPQPTYGEYEVACRIAGAEPLKQWGRTENNFAPSMEKILNLINKYHHRAIFICNPNNPTGNYLARPDIEAILDATGDGLLILDEAYVTFVENSWNSIDLLSRGNVVIMRSMTKDFGLAGLRLGYAVAGKEIIDNLRRVCPPWNVNTIAQKMGAVVLEDKAYLEETKKKIRKCKQYLVDELSLLGFQIIPSDANLFLMRVNDARNFRAALMKYGILVRDCSSFGLPEYIRLAPRTMPECRKLISTIQRLVSTGNLDFLSSAKLS